MAETAHIIHPIPPLFDAQSAVLILGSFPSVKSREARFFYGHPQNRFWRLLAQLLEEDETQTVSDKKRLALTHHIALWDAVHSCTVTGSSDSSIRDVVPNDVTVILQSSQIRQIFCNGATAYRLYQRYIYPQTGFRAAQLPSTSPANAAWSLQRLTEAWRVVTEYI